MPTDHETSLIATKALTKIEQHMETCDRRYEEWKDRQDQTITYLQKLSDQIGDMDKTISEVKGAAKVGRAIVAGAAAVSGFMSGMVGHVVIK